MGHLRKHLRAEPMSSNSWSFSLKPKDVLKFTGQITSSQYLGPYSFLKSVLFESDWAIAFRSHVLLHYSIQAGAHGLALSLLSSPPHSEGFKAKSNPSLFFKKYTEYLLKYSTMKNVPLSILAVPKTDRRKCALALKNPVYQIKNLKNLFFLLVDIIQEATHCLRQLGSDQLTHILELFAKDLGNVYNAFHELTERLKAEFVEYNFEEAQQVHKILCNIPRINQETARVNQVFIESGHQLPHLSRLEDTEDDKETREEALQQLSDPATVDFLIQENKKILLKNNEVANKCHRKPYFKAYSNENTPQTFLSADDPKPSQKLPKSDLSLTSKF